MKKTLLIILSIIYILLCNPIFAQRFDVFKENLDLWMPQTSGLFAPDVALSDRAGTGDTFRTGAGEVLRRFGLRGERMRPALEPSEETEFVLGFYNPDTVHVIDADTSMSARIILVNNAQLIIRDCEFQFRGNIFATGNSRVIIEDADFILPQDHIYQFQFIAIDSAGIEYRNSRINSSLLPFGVGVTHRAFFEMDSVEMDAAFITFSLMENSRIDINHANGAGEFVVLGDSCSLNISNSDTILIWLGFPKNSSGEVRAPFGMADYVDSFTFPDSTCDGIGYTIEFTDGCGLMIATMAMDSTDVAVFDTELRVCGNIFGGNPVDTISGLVDESHYTDFSPELPGEHSLRLVNSSVGAWNLYTWENTDIAIRSSIFGECLADSLTQTTIMNSTCDGFGGHVGANGSATFVMFYSTLFCDALLEGHSMSMFLLTSFVHGQIIARDRAIALLYNTVLVNPILIYDSATVVETAIRPPSPAWIDDTLSITGTARMLRGPESPIGFEGYRIEYAPFEDTSSFTPLTDRITTPVLDGELCLFPSFGLDVGNYYIRMWYFFSPYGEYDSLEFTNTVYLTYNTGVEEQDLPENMSLSVFPNPFNATVNISVNGSVGEGLAPSRVEIFD
ncbi:MAG: hypothetical protein KAG97_00935, partial [Victivallales bacterium]|nr:hypothetical protein [Victivallales bacterium]